MRIEKEFDSVFILIDIFIEVIVFFSFCFIMLCYVLIIDCFILCYLLYLIDNV